MLMKQKIRSLNLGKTQKFSKKKRITIGETRKKNFQFESADSTRNNSHKKLTQGHHRAVSQFSGKKVRFDLERNHGKTNSLTQSPIFRALEKKEVWQNLVFSLRMQRQNKLTQFVNGKKSFTICFR